MAKQKKESCFNFDLADKDALVRYLIKEGKNNKEFRKVITQLIDAYKNDKKLIPSKKHSRIKLLKTIDHIIDGINKGTYQPRYGLFNELRLKKFGVDHIMYEKVLRGIYGNALLKSSRYGFIQTDEYKDAIKRKVSISKEKIYIITCAQNNTPAHKELFNNILRYMDYIKQEMKREVELLVVPIRYKNPTSVFIDKEYERWDPVLLPYLIANDVSLNNEFVLLGSVKIQPTAVNPLQNVYQLGRGKSIIVGHTKQHLVCFNNGVNTSKAFTSGSITIENYTDSKTGKRGEFTHSLGFVIVDGNKARYVSATKNGSFIDVNIEVTRDNIKKTSEIEGIVLGDIHFGSENDKKYKMTKEIIKNINPKYIVLHDVFDGKTISPYRQKSLIELSMLKNSKMRLKDELDLVCKRLVSLSDEFKNSKVLIVKSNHDEFLDRWINNKLSDIDIDELYEYSELVIALLENKQKEDVLSVYFNKKYKRGNVVFLKRTDFMKIAGWLVSIHGDIGINGKKASISSFSKVASKIIIGHFHTPYRKDNIAAVGALQDQSIITYSKGLQTWDTAHVIIYKNGKLQHIFI